MSTFLGMDLAAPTFVEPFTPERKRRTVGGASVGRRTGTTRWRVDTALEPTPFGDPRRTELAVHRARHGITRAFVMRMPQLQEIEWPRDAMLSTRLSRAGASEITLASDQDFTLPLGAFVSFGNHAKVYQVEAEAKIIKTGEAVRIVPALETEVPDDATWTPEPLLTCTYAEESDAAWHVDERSIVTGRIVVEEE